MTAARRRDSSWARFGSPVSVSKNASLRSSASARTRSVMSWPDSTATMRPLASASAVACQAIRRRAPVRVTTSLS